MDLKQLRYFQVVAREGSLHRAASRLLIAQPALSRRIRDLETELDVELFIRSARGVKLSPAGEVLLKEAAKLLDQAELAKQRTRQAARGQFGSVHVGLTTVVAEMRFALAAMAEARRLMPEVNFRVSLVNSDDQLQALDKEEIDVGLLYRRPPLPRDVVYQDLRVDRYVVMVPSDHRLARRRSVRLAELNGEDMIFPKPDARPITHREMMGVCISGGLEPRVIMETDRLINIVAEGFAIALYNSALAESERTSGVTYLEIEDVNVPLHLAAMWKKGRETPAIQQLVDLLVSGLRAAEHPRKPRKLGVVR